MQFNSNSFKSIKGENLVSSQNLCSKPLYIVHTTKYIQSKDKDIEYTSNFKLFVLLFGIEYTPRLEIFLSLNATNFFSM